ncbi:DUF3857 domain-containing protein [Chryseobacterium koreense]|nr:DUF3857 domain-containing protein [Chryseobacterium koreense]MBB5332144.1 transglutaminase-like putative cysteine protease [Chryseobacterium koreense]
MKQTLRFALCFVMFTAASQDTKWGKLSPEEIALTEVSYEPTADAVILSEVGKLKITDYGYELEEYGRTKILAPSGFGKAERKWSFRTKRINDNVVLKGAQTINIVDGKTVISPVEKKDIIVSNVNGIQEIAIAFPNVGVGSVIEYKVEISRPYDLFASPWRFQNDIPTLSSKLSLQLASNFAYRMILNGAKLTKKYGGKKNVREWELFNLPSSQVFTHIYNPEDFREKLFFQFTAEQRFHGTYYSENSWNGFKRVVATDLSKSMKNVDFATISMKIPNGATKFETLKNTVEYLRGNFEWDRYVAFRTGNLQDDFLKTKKGNSADFNILLQGILKTKGIRSELVINSLRSTGQIITAYPIFSRLQTINNIVEIDQGEKLLIDGATSDPKNLKYPSLNFFNNIVLELESPVESFLSISPNLSQFISVQELELNSEQGKLSIQDRVNGYLDTPKFKPEHFYVFKGAKNRDSKEVLQNDWKISESTVTFEKSTDSFLMIENPFSKTMRELSIEKDRDYPIMLDYPFQATVQLKTKLPTNFSAKTDGFEQKVSAFGGNLQFVQGSEKVDEQNVFTWTLLINKVVFNTNEIAEYQVFMNKVNEAISKPAVIRKN